MDETRRMLGVYADFAENYMAMPVIQGEKTAGERFPGAVATFSIEAMMQDHKALQAGTSHFLGQNFARAQNIKFQDQQGQEAFAWTTSWGVSTRLVGGVVMMHGDDDGLVLPPRLAPLHVALLPIYRTDEERSQVLAYCRQLLHVMETVRFDGEPLRVRMDDRDIRGGEKAWQHIKRGVPIRMEVGPRDLAADSPTITRRDRPAREKSAVPQAQLAARLPQWLEDMQQGLLAQARRRRDAATRSIDSLEEFVEFFTPEDHEKPEIHGGLAWCHFAECPEMEEKLKELKVTIRCLPLGGEDEPGRCIFSGRPSRRRGVFAKAY
jgi:prolyl-tRNA synthetase